MEGREGMSLEVAGEASEAYHSTAARGENPSQSGGAAAAAAEAMVSPPPPPPSSPPPPPPPPAHLSGAVTGMKKKRGRPRKYRPDGSVTLLSPMPISASAADGSGSFSLVPVIMAGTVPAVKRGRGRPLGSLNKPKPVLSFSGELVGCSAGGQFMPHVITIPAGEDVTMKIISFSQQRPGATCILSANGAISSVALRQPDSSGGTLTYEGRFEILSLSGSFMPTEIGGTKSRTGGMSVSLASADGRVVGGGVAGLLVAATPVQVMVGCFIPSNPQEQKTQKPKTEYTTMASPAAAIPISSADVDAAYRGQGQHSSTTSKPNITAASSFRGENWALSHSIPDSRNTKTDINMSLPVG